MNSSPRTRAAWLAIALGLAELTNPVVRTAAADGRDESQTDEARLLARLNEVRRQANVPLLVPDARLAGAAQRHAAYLRQVGQPAHRESDPAMATPEARMARAGVVADRVGELVYAAPGVGSDLSAGPFVSSVFHRLTLLCPDLHTAGVGAAATEGRSFVTVDMASAPHDTRHPSSPLIVWPPNGMREVPAAINPAVEVPDPLPGHNRAGYPVSIQVRPDQALRVLSFELREVDSEDPLPVWMAAHESDERVPAWGAFILSTVPLRVGTQFEASFAGEVNGSVRRLRWRFTTATPQLHPSAQLARAGERIQFVLSGVDPTEGWSVCVSGTAQMTELRLESATRFSFYAGRCAQQRCPVAVRVGYDSACANTIAETTLDIVDAAEGQAPSARARVSGKDQR